LTKGRIAEGRFFTEDNVIAPTSRQHCILLQQWRCDAVILISLQRTTQE